jgi:hypothetical protein
MSLKKAYYTEAAVISLNRPYMVEVEDQVLKIDIPHQEFGLLKAEQDKHPIQELLFDKVKNLLGTGEFYLIPSQTQVELDAFRDAQFYHPENFPMGDDESMGGF